MAGLVPNSILPFLVEVCSKIGGQNDLVQGRVAGPCRSMEVETYGPTKLEDEIDRLPI
jgi:hypothetical protein